MAPLLIRLLALAAGWFFVALGVVGLFLPFLQGIFFLIIGVYLLAKFSPKFRTWMRTYRGKHRHLDTFLDKIEERLGADGLFPGDEKEGKDESK